MGYDPVVKQVKCPECGKESSVRVLTTSTSVTFHCPHCKKITKASL